MTYDEFLDEWNNNKDVLYVKTSGSTGVPKVIGVEKKRMLASAKTTCDFLGLKSGDKALLCLPLDYIAGKMMVVRSLERNLRLTVVTPSNLPFETLMKNRTIDSNSFDFVAMIPSQVFCTVNNPEQEKLLRRVKHLIIGGGAVGMELEGRLRDFPNHVWSTYGMTETLSHIALRRVNGTDASEWYTVFDGVDVTCDDNGCLVIDAPNVCDGTLHTNDIVELNENGRQFRVIGRKDNVICSGGVKIHMEDVEANLSRFIHVPFAVTKKKDAKFGEVCVLVMEEIHKLYLKDCDLHAAFEQLEKYKRPKEIIYVEKIPLTDTGKIQRKRLEGMVAEM